MLGQIRTKLKELEGVISAYETMIEREKDEEKIDFFLMRIEDAKRSLKFFKERLKEHEQMERKFL